MFRTLAIKFFNWLFPVRRELNSQEISSMTTATIAKNGNRFQLIQRGVGVINTYTRRRDAVRGAERLGLVLA
jgi:hypothetical protein